MLQQVQTGKKAARTLTPTATAQQRLKRGKKQLAFTLIDCFVKCWGSLSKLRIHSHPKFYPYWEVREKT